MAKMPTVTHGGVHAHTGLSWTHALGVALECIGKTATVAERDSIVRSLIKREVVWHEGVLLQGTLTDG